MKVQHRFPVGHEAAVLWVHTTSKYSHKNFVLIFQVLNNGYEHVDVFRVILEFNVDILVVISKGVQTLTLVTTNELVMDVDLMHTTICMHENLPAATTTLSGHLSAEVMNEVKNVMMLSLLMDLRWFSEASLW